MLTAHVDDFNQLIYDQGGDFTVAQDASGVAVLTPLNDDARGAFLILQHAVNRVAQTLNLPPISENGVISQNLFLNIFQIANSTAVISQAQPFIADLKANDTFNTFVQLGPFRSKLVPGPDLTAFMNATLLDLGQRARLWGSLFAAIADTIWWSTLSNATTPVVPTTSSKLPVIVAAILGTTLGIGATALVFVRRRGIR